MFGVGTLRPYTVKACDSRTPDFVNHVSARTYGFLVVTTRRKSKSSKRLRRGGAFSLSPCRASGSRFPPQTWASGRRHAEEQQADADLPGIDLRRHGVDSASEQA